MGLAPAYLRDRCCPTPDTKGRSSLRSLEQRLLFVPFAPTSATQAHVFSVVGPSVWNGLPQGRRPGAEFGGRKKFVRTQKISEGDLSGKYLHFGAKKF